LRYRVPQQNNSSVYTYILSSY